MGTVDVEKDIKYPDYMLISILLILVPQVGENHLEDNQLVPAQTKVLQYAPDDMP